MGRRHGAGEGVAAPAEADDVDQVAGVGPRSRLEIDLGNINGSDLEAAIVARLPSRLRRELADRLIAETLAGSGPRPRESSGLELISVVATTGTLPWWADASRPGLMEETLIRKALEKTGGNRTAAAKLLEISHRALLYKIKDYGIRD